MRDVLWAYGITTDCTRPDVYRRTVESLALAGFGWPRVFEDKEPRLGVFGRWVTGLWELLVREPAAHFYALFQDDVAAVRELRTYLERTLDPGARSYWNLYTCPFYAAQAKPGWFTPVPPLGRGALGLVFPREAVFALLSSPSFVRKPCAATRPNTSVDGAIVEALVNQRPYDAFTETAHGPSLLQHTGGLKSTLGGPERWRGLDLAPDFPGEEYNACALLPT